MREHSLIRVAGDDLRTKYGGALGPEQTLSAAEWVEVAALLALAASQAAVRRGPDLDAKGNRWSNWVLDDPAAQRGKCCNRSKFNDQHKCWDAPMGPNLGELPSHNPPGAPAYGARGVGAEFLRGVRSHRFAGAIGMWGRKRKDILPLLLWGEHPRPTRRTRR